MEALTITGAVFAGLGALLFALGVVLVRANRRFDRRAVRAPGLVTGVKWEAIGPAADRTMTGFPELRFTLPDGREVETVARTGTTFDAMKEGSAGHRALRPGRPAPGARGQPAAQPPARRSPAPPSSSSARAGPARRRAVAAGIALEDALPAVIRP